MQCSATARWLQSFPPGFSGIPYVIPSKEFSINTRSSTNSTIDYGFNLVDSLTTCYFTYSGNTQYNNHCDQLPWGSRSVLSNSTIYPGSYNYNNFGLDGATAINK